MKGIKLNLYRKITRLLLKLAWYFADDATFTCVCIREAYDNVPEAIKDVVIDYYYFYLYDNVSKQEKVDRWVKDDTSTKNSTKRSFL